MCVYICMQEHNIYYIVWCVCLCMSVYVCVGLYLSVVWCVCNDVWLCMYMSECGNIHMCGWYVCVIYTYIHMCVYMYMCLRVVCVWSCMYYVSVWVWYRCMLCVNTPGAVWTCVCPHLLMGLVEDIKHHLSLSSLVLWGRVSPGT